MPAVRGLEEASESTHQTVSHLQLASRWNSERRYLLGKVTATPFIVLHPSPGDGGAPAAGVTVLAPIPCYTMGLQHPSVAVVLLLAV